MHVFSLSDAVTLYYKQLDLAHKLWAYLQVVAGAAATLATAYYPNKSLVIVIFVGFILFAIGNCYFLYLAQRDISNTGAAVQQAWPKASEWSAILPAFTSWRLRQVVALHVLIDVAVLVLVVVQFLRC